MNPLEKFTLWQATSTFQKTREAFYEDLAEAINDKESYTDFIAIRRERAAKQKDPLLPLYTIWLSRTAKDGGRLSSILKGFAPDADIMIIAAMEDKGDLANGLKFLGSTVKDQQEMKASIVAAISMPIVVTILMVGLMVLLSLGVIPKFAEIAPVSRWNLIGRILYKISYSITNYGIFMLAALMGGFYWFIWSLPNWTGPRRKRLDEHLPYRIYRDYSGSIFLVSLASMLRAGDSLVNALGALRKRGSTWQRWHIAKIIKNMDGAKSYGEAFGTGIFSQTLTNRLIDYSRRSPKFDQVVARIGIEGIAKVRKEINVQAKVLNVILITVLGALLGFMFVGVILTAQGLNQSIKEDIAAQTRGGVK
jgi:toxin co-regulated pilus biosynthesis protein E